MSLTTSLTAAEPVQLFNGKNLDGWEAFLDKPGVKMEDVWSVDDGRLVCKGEPMGYLATKAKYTNFKLTVEWRWPKEPGNSGVLMRITGEPKALPRCAEAQMQHGSAGNVYGFHGYAVSGPEERVKKTAGHKLGGDLTAVVAPQGCGEAGGRVEPL